MFQRRYTIDYGSRKSGSRPAGGQLHYYPVFHLDMLSIVGHPLLPITHRSGFFDNVTFSLRYWQAGYSSKHVSASLPFDLTHRTFRIATGASREVWFVVMHPLTAAAPELPAPGAQRRRRQDSSVTRSAMERHHAEALADYIKGLFLDGELVGEGVEPLWALGGSQSRQLSYDKWSAFQRLFMDGWPAFADRHAFDTFWRNHQPAFHAYDHGANIEIEVHQTIEELATETSLRRAGDEDDSGADSTDESTDDGANEADGGYEANEANEGVRRSGEEGDEGEVGHGEAPDEVDSTPGAMLDDDPLALYTGSLEQLRSDLENKYNLANVDQVSYALAADINCITATRPSRGDPDDEGGTATLCLLADRSVLARQYGGGARGFRFYPLAFHPRYGNFSSPRPPMFLERLCTVMRDNMSYQNNGADVLSFGFFQGYSNIKRTIRSRPADLLATQGMATAALALPPSETRQDPRLRARQQRLLRSLRGGRTPDHPAVSTPFAREGQRIRAAIAQDQVAFRMEQVVTVRTGRLPSRRRQFARVLHPIFQLMRFFLKESQLYQPILRTFPPSLFPGILASYARLFELALGELARRFQARGDRGLTLALSEAVAVLDRLGSYCFTGDPRGLVPTIMGPLMTMESLRKGAWPFVSPDMLDVREPLGSINMACWPRTVERRPALVHVAALSFHYGPVVAAQRYSHIWFSQVAESALGPLGTALHFLENIFHTMWVPQTVAFMSFQLRRQLGRGQGRGVGLSAESSRGTIAQRLADLRSWESCEQPFSQE